MRLQDFSQALQDTLKAFGLQQQALLACHVQDIAESSRRCEAALAHLQSLDMPISELENTEADPRTKLLQNMVRQQLQQLQKLSAENTALLQQSQQLNQQQLDHLVTLHKNTQPSVYGAQGEHTAEYQPARSAYDFSA